MAPVRLALSPLSLLISSPSSSPRRSTASLSAPAPSYAPSTSTKNPQLTSGTRPQTYEQPRADLDVTLPPRPFLAPYTAVAPRAYTPTAPFAPAFNSALTGAGVGLFVSAIKNSLETHNKGAMGVFSRTGWLIGYFGQSARALSLSPRSRRR